MKKDNPGHTEGHKFVIFDLDGTLIDSFEWVSQCINRTLNSFELEELTKDELEIAYCVGDLFYLISKKGLPISITEFKKKFDTISSSSNRISNVVINNQAIRFIRLLKHKYLDCKIVVLTNKKEQIAVELTKRLFPQIIDVVIGRKSDKPLKLSPDLVKARLSQNGLNIKDCLLYCGDSIEDENLAAKLNIHFIYCDIMNRSTNSSVEMGSSLGKGLNYITSLITTFRILSNDTYITSPKYIFRGVTQRHFTSSNVLGNLLCKLKRGVDISPIENEILTIIKYYNLDITDLTEKKLYSILNNQTKSRINENISTQIDSIDYSSFLLSIIRSPKYFFRYIEPLFIRSSCAVRLNGQMTEHRQIDYLWYLRNLITEAQRMYPEYSSQSDLEILADLQHKGASTCLVDFSRNFLVALWFATQNYSSADNETGYLFCYDINNDAITKDNIEIVNTGFKEKRTIEDILQCTRKSVKYDGNDSLKFVVWTPSNINSRIVRQDSVFVLGIEKFEIKRHPVITIPIPHCWKKPIQTALKTFFGISSESLYADNGGFASSNSKADTLAIKSAYFNDQIFDASASVHINNFDLFQKGTGCLMKGEYSHALDYFTSFEALNSFNIALTKKSTIPTDSLLTQIIHLECLYSKALCYRHLANDDVTAVNLYKQAFDECSNLMSSGDIVFNSKRHISSQNQTPPEKRVIEYLANKRFKILDDYIGLLLDLKYHKIAFETICGLILEFKNSNDDSSLIMLETANAEIITLAKLYKNSNFEKIKIKEACELTNFSNRNQPLCSLLNKLFINICDIIDNPKDTEYEKYETDIEKKFIQLSSIFNIRADDGNSTFSNENLANDLFSEWDLTDIKSAISEYCKTKPKKRKTMLNMLSYVDRFIRLIEGYRRVESY